MANETTRPLKVFLCHASGDKPAVRDLYKRLVEEGVDAWLDEEKLLPGQDWNDEILRALQESDAIIICLSKTSVSKEGYVQREIKEALEKAKEKPSGTIFVIPSKLDECEIPNYLTQWQWVDLYKANGFVKLLRSLKLRADRVGATIEPSGYESEDKETERRLDQLYTEGLAAFYTEDWDRAYQRFQAILRERPNHKNAAEKLAQAEQHRSLVKLYAQATEAYQSENWPAAIKAFDELLEKSGDYKDAAHLLKDSKKQKQLRELYTEAKRLHAAQKWQAVLRVFDQITGIDSGYPDPDGLLPSAQREAAELKRLADLNDLYSQSVHKMDAGQWYEARDLLEQVHKAQTGYLDTERLLRKVENEIVKVEEERKRDAQVQMLYEQARKMMRAGQWSKALAQMNEIQKLNNQFVDNDGILEKAKAELAREEQEAQQRRALAALYAEAVGLLEAKKYQEALEKWNEIQAIDPKYKDTARVKTIARRKLDELSRPEVVSKSWPKIATDWLGFEASISTDHVILTEKLLLLSFVVVVIIHELWARAQGWFHIWEWESVNVHVLRFVVAALLGGLYGIVVALNLNKVIYNWQTKHSLTVIVGWALAIGLQWLIGGVFDTSGFFDSNLLSILFLFSGLATVVAIKWSKPATSPISMILILVGWALAWWAGETLGGYTTGNALTVLLGLLFTFGMQIERSREVLGTAFFGALGFAVGNYISYLVGLAVLSFPIEIVYPLEFALWGLLGGAILEIPSRDSRRILSSAAICGIGLLVGSYVAFGVFPAYVNSTLSERYATLRQPFFGIGLGLAFGLLIGRASAIGVLTVLGAGMYMLTRALNQQAFNLSESWENILRGVLIGLVLGYAYGYMPKAKWLEPKLETANVKLSRMRIGFLVSTVVLSVAIIAYRTVMGPQTFLNPMFGGYRLDWCYLPGTNCGEAAATEWCQRRGYTELVSFEQDLAVWRRGIDTKVISSGYICNGSGGVYCDSFKSITCKSP